jgi:hypothetical protein
MGCVVKRPDKPVKRPNNTIKRPTTGGDGGLHRWAASVGGGTLLVYNILDYIL